MQPLIISILSAAIVALISSGITTFVTIKVLKVRLEYTDKHVSRVEKEVEKAHDRIDELNKRFIQQHS